MKYNQHNLNCAKIHTDNNIKPCLNAVAFYGNRTIATDGVRLIEITSVDKDDAEHSPVIYDVNAIKSIKLKKGEKINDDQLSAQFVPINENYPDVDHVLNEAEKQDYLEIKINAGLLSETLGILAKMSPFKTVKLRVPLEKKNQAIMIEAEDKKTGQRARALVMPQG